MRVLVSSKFRYFSIFIIATAFLVTGCNAAKKQVFDEGFADAFKSVDVPINDRFLSGGPEEKGELTQKTVKDSRAVEKFTELSRKNPKSILIDGNRMLVSDWVQRTLVSIDMVTKKEAVFVPAIDFVSDMVKDRNGNIIAGLFTGEQVVTIDRSAKVTKIAGNLGKVSAVTVSPNNDIYAASFDRGIVYKLSRDVSRDPEVLIDNLQNPAGLSFGSDGRLYISQFSSSSESILRFDVNVLTKEVFAIGISQAARMVFVGPKLYIGGAEAGRAVIWSFDSLGNGEVLVAGEFDDPIVGPVGNGKYLYFGSSSGAEKNIYRIGI